MFWREVKKARKGMKVKEECVKDGSGRVLSKGSEVCDRWKEYFDGLLNVSEGGRAEITTRPEMNVRAFEKAKEWKRGKASGVDE